MTTAPKTTAKTDLTLDELTEQGIAARSEGAGEPAWLRDRRLEAFKSWVDQSWPALRGEELWKDTPFSRFDVDLPLVAGGEGGERLPSDLLDAIDDLGARANLVDGTVDITVSAELTDAGVIVSDLATAAREHEDLVREHLGSLTAAHDRTVTANDAAWTTGVFVYVPEELELDRAIGISVQVTDETTILPRVLTVVDRHARARVYVEHVSADGCAATVDEVTETIVLDGAEVDFASLQDWEGDVGHLAVQAAALHRDASMRHLAVTIGGRTVRLRPEVRLVGPGATIEPLGVYFSDEGQHFEHHPFIEHVAGNTKSDVMYKGALQGASRTVFRGHIFVHKDATGSDSNEVNKSLILTEGAKADSTPFLEIECSEVTAGHGSATGQVDEDQLFYLESRGLATENALRLIVFGFFAEVLERIDLPQVRERTMAHIEDEIERADLSNLAARTGTTGRHDDVG